MYISNLSNTTSSDKIKQIIKTNPTLTENDTYVETKNYLSGINSGTEVTLYTPNAPISQIPRQISQGYGTMNIAPDGERLGYYCIVDSKDICYYAKDY